MIGDTDLLITKLLPVFVYPLGSAIALLVLAGLLRTGSRIRAARFAAALGIGWLWVASTPAFSDWALSTLERQNPPRPVSAYSQADVIILLGGALRTSAGPLGVPDLLEASDRILFAARLFKAGKAKRILVTGGNLPWVPSDKPEAMHVKDLLVEWGVPSSAIASAGDSRNTFENALEVEQMRATTPFRSALLITSAAHMPRALAVFQKRALPVTPASADFLVTRARTWTALRWLPTAHALHRTTIAFKEWIGMIAYRWRGYV